MFEKKPTTSVLSILTITVLSLSSHAVTWAAESDQVDSDSRVIEEVMVTARRKSESLQDVPGTVSAITSSTIEKVGIERAEDFIGITPGVSLVNSAEAGDTQVNIRGINGARDAENSFAFILDGILYSNPASFNREYTNLQQIEIFKGPQGALYGRNAAAGAMIVTTKKPGEEFAGNLTASLAEDSTSLVKGEISGPLTANTSYVLSGDYRSSDGFRRNAFKNNSATIDAFESSNLKARLIYEPTDNLSMDLKTRVGSIDANSIGFNATFHLPNFADATVPEANEDVNDHEFVFQPNIDSDNDQDAFELSGKFDYQMANSTLTGWALYTDIENDLIADGTSGAFGFYAPDAACQQSITDLNAAGVTLPAPQFFGANPFGVIFDPMGSFLGPYTPSTCDGIQEQLRNQKDLSAEIRLASSGESTFDWMLGAFIMEIERQVGVSLNRDGGAVPIRGLLQTSGPNRTDQLIYDQFDSSVYAVFGQLGYDLSDTVEASLALRYDVEDREVSSLVPTDLTQSIIDLNFDGVFDDPLNPGLSSLVNPTGTIADKSEKYKQLQPKFSLTWDANENTTVFGNYGKGFKAGGFNNSGSAATVSIFNNTLISGNAPGLEFLPDFADALGTSLPVITDDYKKEVSDALELGFKSTLMDGRLKLNGAVYNTQVDDMQFFEFFVGSFGLLRVVSNIDEVDITGFEVGADAAVGDNANLYLGYNSIDSEIKANSSRPDTVGNESPYTPDYTLNLGGDVSFPISNSFDLNLRLDGQRVGPTWFHTVQAGPHATIFNPLIELGFGTGAGGLGNGDFTNAQRDAYTTWNLRAGLNADNWSVTAFVDNLTDEDYVEEVIPAPEFGGSFNFPGSQRRAGLEFSYKF